MSYITLHQFKYNGSGPSLTKTEAKAEYFKRMESDSVWKTNLYPLLTDSNGGQSDDFPIFFENTTKMYSKIQKITNNSRQIRRLVNTLPGIAGRTYTNEVLANEIFFTNEIEGVKTNREDIKTMVDEQKNDKTPTKKRLQSTVRMYRDIFNQKIIKIYSLEDIRRIYDSLLQGEIPDKKLPDGKYFRNKEVWIGSAMKSFHRPPKNESEISDKLKQLIYFMNDADVPEIPKAIVTHFMFENTHPFYDGNGRTGRYLLSEYLSSKIDPYTGLIISTSIHNEQSKYYKIFKEAERRDNFGDLTVFIEQILSIIIEGQLDVRTNLVDKLEAFNKSAKILNKVFAHTEEYEEANLKKWRIFSVFFILLQSYLFNMDDNGITDTQLINFWYNTNTRVFKKNKMPEIIGWLEENNWIYRAKSNPIIHKFTDSTKVTLNLAEKD
ncbi:hypothetical protein BSQ39_09400 [Loigolactobacillus backii]|uniref:Uncharacterized protein n=1 Tax=Loigolactobacillus backii TaxID=375175 RepID=A0A192H4D2_9LACO|nr:Fic family protein [Loigolactobacillus backii]ANK63230.1 hypothetical protein AYR53_10905 [Loigolactobacillus backii]ANK69764.1 hypothetical protein AYR56_06100 [Loigolactobacillus backii]PIO83766.1 hypothetical protein BSQ39_09400 [Loigolactobacillus backii]